MGNSERVRGLTLSCENGKSGGVGGLQLKFPPWWGSGYFLDTHNKSKSKMANIILPFYILLPGMLVIEQSPQDAVKVIKEGQVEKKGHNAAFMMWPR